MKTILTKKQYTFIAIHILLILISIPYGFVSWLFGITPHVYYDPMYKINLIAIAAYDLAACIAIILTLKFRARYPYLLYLPFIFFAISSIALVYFIAKY